MKIQFDQNQAYQLEAIDAVVRVFDGQALAARDFELSVQPSWGAPNAGVSQALIQSAVANVLTITPEQILHNVQAVQRTYNQMMGEDAASQKRHIAVSEQLKPMMVKQWLEMTCEDPCDSPLAGWQTVATAFPNLSIEMETGTGKTYVYLRTIFELNRLYGFTKFVIAVPSVAIREGVLKNLQITAEHFNELYRVPAQFHVYDSKKLNVLSNFARSNAIQILVMNIDAFAGDGVVINQVREQGIAPIEFIQATHPIVIVDEPQNFETETRRAALANLNPLCCLRYSATHKEAYDLIYKLDPVRAYDLGLVKQIEVDSVVEAHANSGAFVKIEKFKKAAKSIAVQLSIHKAQANGVDKVSVTARVNDDLYQLSNQVEAYRDGYQIVVIDSEEGFVEFANGEMVELGQASGGLNDEIQQAMIRATIERHLEKEKRFAKEGLGVKVLSIFFIDRVANYRTYDESGAAVAGKFARWFEEILAQLLQSPRFRGMYADFAVGDLHDGYFSEDKQHRVKDSKEKSTKDDQAAFELIMRDKERLLDMQTPLRFIFSHSALREGWDNPNVFQICTLNETVSTVKKRQEIGRGLRLCVNQNGERIHARDVNCLTVVANESYEGFAKALQTEIEEDTGVDFSGRIKNANRDKVFVRNRSKWRDDAVFLDLWARIRHKTQYRVMYDTDELIASAAEQVRAMPEVLRPQIVRTLAQVDVSNTGVNATVTKGMSQSVDGVRYPIPDFVGFIQSKTELTRQTVIRIIEQSGRLSDVLVNPQMFMEQAARAINFAFDQLKIDHIKYEKIANEFYQVEIFDIGEIERYLDNLVPVTQLDKTVCDYIETDSPTERAFAQACDAREDVLFYVKLPRQFKIKTPLGNYNPDWALIKRENEDAPKLYFVAETKGAAAMQDQMTLRLKELGKIKCGAKHFELFKEQVTFKVVSEVAEI